MTVAPTLNGTDLRLQVAEELRKTLGTLFAPGQLIELRIFGEKKGQIDSGYFKDHEKLIAAALKYDGSAPQYVTVNDIHPGLIALYNNKIHPWATKTTSDKDVLSRRWLPFEFDPERPSGIPANDAEYHEAHARAQACRDWVRSQGWPDPVYADSGNGAWLLYPLDTLPATDDVEHTLKACCAVISARFSGGSPAVKVDQTVYNASRIVRLFGTRNLKGDGDANSGRIHRPSGILDGEHGEPMSLETLEAFVAAHSSEPAVQKATKRAPKKTDKPTGPWTKESIAALIERHNLSILEDEDYDGGYKWLLEACPFDDSHRDRSAVIILGSGGTFGFRCQHDSCSGKNGQAFLQLLGEVLDPNDPRPRIPVRDLDIPKIAKAAWEALTSATLPLYRRDGMLYELTEDDEGAPILREVNKPILRGYLSRVAVFVQFREKQNKLIEWLVEPPPVVVDDMLVNVDERVPLITRVTRCPVVAPDGAIVNTPGYDAATRLYYAPRPGVEIPNIPETPTEADMAAARSFLLDELFADFMFVSEADKAHAIALFLLPYLRDAIRGPTPLHLVEAPGPGSGKTLLADVVMLPAFGAAPTPITEAGDDDEWRKRITSVLSTTPAAVYIDNVNRTLAGSAISSALTATTWSDRLLGTNKTMSVPVRCVWVATANNPTLSDEVARRCIRIRIDPRVDRPWKREGFKHADLRQWSIDNQGELIGAALTLIRYGMRATEGPTTSLGSFEAWSHLMGRILHAIGIPGFLGNLDELYDRADTEGAAWRALVATWWEKFEGGLVPVGELFDLFKEGDYDLNINGKDEKGLRAAFGKRLKKQQDRIISGYQVVLYGVTNKVNVWMLRSAGVQGVQGVFYPQPTHMCEQEMEPQADTRVHGNDRGSKPPEPPETPESHQQVLEPVDDPCQERYDDLARRYQEARGEPLDRRAWGIDELDDLEAWVEGYEALLEEFV